MPIPVSSQNDIQLGEIYEDSAYHPCLCMGVEGHEIWGISLIDGTYPRCEDIGFSGVRKLTLEEAWEWKLNGPSDIDLEEPHRWWGEINSL